MRITWGDATGCMIQGASPRDALPPALAHAVDSDAHQARVRAPARSAPGRRAVARRPAAPATDASARAAARRPRRACPRSRAPCAGGSRPPRAARRRAGRASRRPASWPGSPATPAQGSRASARARDHRPHRRPDAAAGRLERREVVRPLEPPRGQVHRRPRRAAAARASSTPWRTAAARRRCQMRYSVGLAGRAVARVETRRGVLDRQRRGRRAGSIAFRARRITAASCVRGDARRRHLPQRVHAGIGPAGAVDDDRRALDAREGILEQPLDRHALGLPLPADVGGAVVGNVSLRTRSCRCATCQCGSQ